jgi:tryptophan-rich sensory protein
MNQQLKALSYIYSKKEARERLKEAKQVKPESIIKGIWTIIYYLVVVGGMITMFLVLTGK